MIIARPVGAGMAWQVPSRTGTGGRERAALGSRSGLGSRGSLPSRSSVRAPGTPLGVVVEEQDRASPLQAVAEDCDNSFDKFEDAEMNTARVGRLSAAYDHPKRMRPLLLVLLANS